MHEDDFLFCAEGYEDVVVHVSLLQVVRDGVLVDLGQQHHVVHAAHLHVLSLPMVTLLAPLWGWGIQTERVRTGWTMTCVVLPSQPHDLRLESLWFVII